MLSVLDDKAKTILSHKVMTQGEPLSMEVYGLDLFFLIKYLQEAVTYVHQTWYLDDDTGGGIFTFICNLWDYINAHSPERD